MIKNWIKSKAVEKLKEWGVVVRPLAADMRARFKSFGEGSWIEEPLGNIQNPRNITIGRGCVIQAHVNLETSEIYHPSGQKFTPDLVIGNGTCIRSHVSIYCNHSVRIGKNVLIGERVCITDVDHGYADPSVSVGKQALKENTFVVLEDGCFIGYGAIILPNVRIGKNAVVGAGAVVTKDVPDYAIAVGNPARVIKNLIEKWTPDQEFKK